MMQYSIVQALMVA
jgi:hypothetical protein